MNQSAANAHRKGEANARTGEKAILFRLGTQMYGVPLNDVREVLEFQEAKPLPRMAKGCLGILQIRGEVVSVIDLTKVLDIEPIHNERRALIVVPTQDGSVAGVVDAIDCVVPMSPSSLEKIPTLGSLSNGVGLKGVFEHKGRQIVLMDLCAVLTQSNHTTDHTGRESHGHPSDNPQEP